MTKNQLRETRTAAQENVGDWVSSKYRQPARSDEVASKRAMLLPGWFAFAKPEAVEQKDRRQFELLTIHEPIR